MVRPVEGPRTGAVIENTEEGVVASEEEAAPEETGPPITPDAESAAHAKNKAMSSPVAAHLKAQLEAQLDHTDCAEETTPTAAFQAGHAATAQALSTGTELATFAAEAVAGATNLAGTGRITTHGTISRGHGGRFTYSPTPTDKLVVPAADGRGNVELKFHDVRGASFKSVDAFFAGEHSLDFDVERGDDVDLRISSTRRGNTRTATARGSLDVDGTEYDVNLTYQTQEQVRLDGVGSDFGTRVGVTGTVSSETGGTITVDETADIQGATAEVRDGLGGRAHSTLRTINNRLRIGEDEYRWRGVSTRTSFRNGRPSNVDTYWRAQGNITRNGEAYGSYRLRSAGGEVQIQLETPEEVIRLEGYRLTD